MFYPAVVPQNKTDRSALFDQRHLLVKREVRSPHFHCDDIG